MHAFLELFSSQEGHHARQKTPQADCLDVCGRGPSAHDFPRVTLRESPFKKSNPLLVAHPGECHRVRPSRPESMRGGAGSAQVFREKRAKGFHRGRGAHLSEGLAGPADRLKVLASQRPQGESLQEDRHAVLPSLLPKFRSCLDADQRRPVFESPAEALQVRLRCGLRGCGVLAEPASPCDIVRNKGTGVRLLFYERNLKPECRAEMTRKAMAARLMEGLALAGDGSLRELPAPPG